MREINRFFKWAFRCSANILFFLACLIYMPSTLARSSPTSNQFTDAQKPVVLHQPNQIFQISLKSNPTTGYIWVLDQFDEQSIKPIQHIYHAPALNNSQGQAVVGAPGQETWSFTLNKSAMRVPRIMKITFCMIRPWTNNCDIKKTFTVIYTHG